MTKVYMLYLQRSHGVKILFHLCIPDKAAHIDAAQAGVGVPRKFLVGPSHFRPVNLG